jgi:hypothetical protein
MNKDHSARGFVRKRYAFISCAAGDDLAGCPTRRLTGQNLGE